MMQVKSEGLPLERVEIGIPSLEIYIIKDDGRFMARCIQLDLVTEMDTSEAALTAIIEMMKEYAEDYESRRDLYSRSPNRAHHLPYIDRVLSCRNKWELMELVEVRYGHLHIQ